MRPGIRLLIGRRVLRFGYWFLGPALDELQRERNRHFREVEYPAITAYFDRVRDETQRRLAERAAL